MTSNNKENVTFVVGMFYGSERQILSYFHYMKLTNHMFFLSIPEKVSILTQNHTNHRIHMLLIDYTDYKSHFRKREIGGVNNYSGVIVTL